MTQIIFGIGGLRSMSLPSSNSRRSVTVPDSERRRVLSVTKRANLPANERLRSDPTDPISIYGSHDTE